MFEIDQTPIYTNFLKKSVFWCLVSGMYIPSPILTRHHKTPQKQNRYQAKKNRHHNYGFSLNYSFHAVGWCLVYD